MKGWAWEMMVRVQRGTVHDHDNSSVIWLRKVWRQTQASIQTYTYMEIPLLRLDLNLHLASYVSYWYLHQSVLFYNNTVCIFKWLESSCNEHTIICEQNANTLY